MSDPISFAFHSLYTISWIVVGVLFARDVRSGIRSESSELPIVYKVTLGLGFMCSAVLGAYSNLSIPLRLAYVGMSLLLELGAFTIALKFFQAKSA